MNWLDFPPLAPPEILATEEALLDAAEAGIIGETLSFWETDRHFVVLGYGNKVSTEVDQAACARLNIPIFRRCSGGGTVLQGPGVLNYSLVLRAGEDTPLSTINGANQFIMKRNADALTALLGKKVAVQGHTDLALDGLKFSGNAQRRKRTHLLFHGAILLNLDLALLNTVLPMPSLQPDYRLGRAHTDFLTQLNIPSAAIQKALRETWGGTKQAKLAALPEDWQASVGKLVTEKYSRADWNLRV